MLRLVVRETDIGSAANLGGPVNTALRTFDLDAPAVEEFLLSKQTYRDREVIGVEVLEPQAAGDIGKLLAVVESFRSAIPHKLEPSEFEDAITDDTAFQCKLTITAGEIRAMDAAIASAKGGEK